MLQNKVISFRERIVKSADVYAARTGTNTSGKASFSPYSVGNYQNAIKNGELPFNVSNSNCVVLGIDMDFMGQANHIDTVAAEKIKFNILEALHDKFDGQIKFYQKSGKFIAMIDGTALSTKLNALDELPEMLNSILIDETLYEYTSSTDGKTYNMAQKLGFTGDDTNRLKMIKVSTATPIKGANPSWFLETMLEQTKGIDAGSALVQINPSHIPKMSTSELDALSPTLDREMLTNIQQYRDSFESAMSILTTTLPEDFMDRMDSPEFSNLNTQTKQMLVDSSLSRWTVRQFNINEGQPGQILVYNKNAILMTLDTMNTRTHEVLMDAVDNAAFSKEERTAINMALKIDKGQSFESTLTPEQAKTVRHVISKYMNMVSADGSHIAAQNNHVGWTFTDNANYTEMCGSMHEKLSAIILQNGSKFSDVKVAVTGGDEFVFMAYTKKPQTQEARDLADIKIANAYKESFAKINSKVRTVTKDDILHSFADKELGLKFWYRIHKKANETSSRVIDLYRAKTSRILGRQLSREEAIQLLKARGIDFKIEFETITMPTRFFASPYNKCKLDIDEFSKDERGQHILKILRDEGLLPKGASGVYELKVKYENITPYLYDFLIDTNILDFRLGINGAAAIGGENSEGKAGLELIADLDNYSQYTKARQATNPDVKCITSRNVVEMKQRKAVLRNHIFMPYHIPPNLNEIIAQYEKSSVDYKEVDRRINSETDQGPHIRSHEPFYGPEERVGARRKLLREIPEPTYRKIPGFNSDGTPTDKMRSNIDKLPEAEIAEESKIPIGF